MAEWAHRVGRWIRNTLIVVAPIAAWIYWPTPDERLLISRETTYLTEPLDADGLPDFAAALEDLRGGAIPASENVVAGLAQVLPFGDLTEETRSAFYDQLGVPQHRVPALLLGIDDPPEESPQLSSLPDPEREPWHREDWPEYAAWLEKVRPALEASQEALRREHSYWPVLRHSLAGARAGNDDVELLARALSARAWLLAESDPIAAAEDTAAVLRLARVLRERVGFFGLHTARRIEDRGAALAFYLLEHGLTDEPSLTAFISTCGPERSRLTRFEEHRIAVLNRILFSNPAISPLGADSGNLANPLLRHFNEQMDLFEQALHLPCEAQEAWITEYYEEAWGRKMAATDRGAWRMVANAFLHRPGRSRLNYLAEQIIDPLIMLLAPRPFYDPPPGTETAMIAAASQVLLTRNRLGRWPSAVDLSEQGWAPKLPHNGNTVRFWPGYDGFLIDASIPGHDDVICQVGAVKSD